MQRRSYHCISMLAPSFSLLCCVFPPYIAAFPFSVLFIAHHPMNQAYLVNNSPSCLAHSPYALSCPVPHLTRFIGPIYHVSNIYAMPLAMTIACLRNPSMVHPKRPSMASDGNLLHFKFQDFPLIRFSLWTSFYILYCAWFPCPISPNPFCTLVQLHGMFDLTECHAMAPWHTISLRHAC